MPNDASEVVESTVANVKKVLEDTGKKLKDDLWRDDDAELLQHLAQDLVGLNAKAAAATDSEKKRRYQNSAKYITRHVRDLALLRLQATEKTILKAIENLFMEILIPALAAILTALF